MLEPIVKPGAGAHRGILQSLDLQARPRSTPFAGTLLGGGSYCAWLACTLATVLLNIKPDLAPAPQCSSIQKDSTD
jgi:hypothetical protein